MKTVHWLGAGLSSAPGIRRLALGANKLIIWNRTVEKAQAIIADLNTDTLVKLFDVDTLQRSVHAGDVIVSMLPGNWHFDIAKLALQKGAHFVSSSYISGQIQALDRQARDASLTLINEVGLDPGIDHLMAHALVDEYCKSEAYRDTHRIAFRSYCGGFPKITNDFRYKFSWSPLGVLKALRSPSRSIRDGQTVDTTRPWEALSYYTARLPNGEQTFQAYPNRDALPFIDAYHFKPQWPIDEFVRGTLRLDGWSTAWKDIFAKLETLEGEAGERQLQTLSDELWRTQRYADGEPDRVVLCVELEARNEQQRCWHRSYVIDACGDQRGSAMARLVSLPVSLAVEATLEGQITAGVVAAPSEPHVVAEWMTKLRALGEQIHTFEHLS